MANPMQMDGLEGGADTKLSVLLVSAPVRPRDLPGGVMFPRVENPTNLEIMTKALIVEFVNNQAETIAIGVATAIAR